MTWEETADARAESNRMPESAVIPKKRKGGGPRVWPHVLDEIQHHYNCAVHNDASYPPGPCDCDCGSGLREALSDFQGYAPLEDVLAEAAQQAAFGKGKERHANGKPFTEQPILEITRSVGLGFPTGQVCKKTQEAIGMVSRGEHEQAVEELLGAIVYAAAAIIQIRENAE